MERKSDLGDNFSSCLWSEQLGPPSHPTVIIQNIAAAVGGDGTIVKERVVVRSPVVLLVRAHL